MARLGMPAEQDVTNEQSLIISEVVSGRRGKVPAPMIAWLRNPELARRGQKLGELLRFETSLEPVLSELAILVCGRHWASHHEWNAHKKIALAAGVDPRIVDDIAAGKVPVITSLREEIVYQISSVLLAKTRLDEKLYQRGIEVLDEKGMVELVAILGYYSMVALTLNAFEIGLPESFASELEPR